MAKTLDLTFAEFKFHVMTAFASTFSPRGTNYVFPDAYDRLGETMLTEYEFSREREQFLIEKAKLFLKVNLSHTESHNTSMNFLEKLANKIAAYLSCYVMNKYPIPESGKSKNKLRIRVQAELKQILFDENSYIVSLKKQQEEKREFRKKTKAARKKIIQNERRRDAADAYHHAQQIKSIFADAQHTPRKMR
ncbi:MAG: hypothetical protein ACI4NZ_00110 [Candidatus Enterousia sp.]